MYMLPLQPVTGSVANGLPSTPLGSDGVHQPDSELDGVGSIVQELVHGPHERGSTRFHLHDLRTRFPGSSHKHLLRLARLLRVAAAWSPVFGEAEQAPSLISSFSHLFGSCELVAFEVGQLELPRVQLACHFVKACKSPARVSQLAGVLLRTLNPSIGLLCTF